MIMTKTPLRFLIKPKQVGGMLIEMLVSMLIGSLMLSGALAVMLNSSLSYKTRNGLSDIDDRGRLALELVAEDIRRSGYRGCAFSESRPIIRTFDTADDEKWVVPELGLRGWEYMDTGNATELDLYALQETGFSSDQWKTLSNTSSADYKGFNSDMLSESDVIELWTALPSIMRISSATADELTVDFSTSGFPSNSDDDHNQLLLVSDCVRNLLVKADDFLSGTVSLDSDNNNGDAALLNDIADAQAVMLQGVLYYLRIPTDASRTRPGLYRKEIFIDQASKDFDHRDAQEIMPGILSLQFQYGESLDENMSANRYVSANEVADWNDVVSVRIFMLVETELNNVVPQGSDFSFQNKTFSPEDSSDKRIRREYTKTVFLRNRDLGVAISEQTP